MSWNRAWMLGLACVLLPVCGWAGQAAANGKNSGKAHPAVNPYVPKLVDITAKTEIHFVHNSSPDAKYIVESMSGGVALIDYNHSGYPSIYFTNAPTVAEYLQGVPAYSALYRNNGDGTFTDVTKQAGVGGPCWAMGASVGDYNNDGWPDLLVSCFGGVVLYRNNGNGTFTDVTRQAGLSGDHGWATGAVFGDYLGNGWDDIFVPHYVKLDLHDLPKLGSQPTCMYRGIPVQCGPRGLPGSPDNLYKNNGNGTFTDVSKEAGVSNPNHYFGLQSTFEDFYGTGKLDLIVGDDGEPNYLYKGDGKGKFTDLGYLSGLALNGDGYEQANMGIALGDYLHTGRLSVAISHFSGEYTTLWRNDGNFTFTDVSDQAGLKAATDAYVGWGDAFVDLNNNGWPDFFQVNGHVYPQVDSKEVGTRYREPKVLFLNRENGTFLDASKLAGPAIEEPQVSRGLAVGDLFNDGHLELVVENLVGGPMILRVEPDPKNHWISLQLAGAKAKGNLLALNARVEIVAGGLHDVQEVRSGGSYFSQSDLRLHFGLGTHTKVDKVIITWDTGEQQVVTGLEADRYYCILQGVGVVSGTKMPGCYSGKARPVPAVIAGQVKGSK
ncbi:MAG: CRTAC1 family protein [Acidobacteriaceae bacterium]